MRLLAEHSRCRFWRLLGCRRQALQRKSRSAEIRRRTLRFQGQSARPNLHRLHIALLSCLYGIHTFPEDASMPRVHSARGGDSPRHRLRAVQDTSSMYKTRSSLRVPYLKNTKARLCPPSSFQCHTSTKQLALHTTTLATGLITTDIRSPSTRGTIVDIAPWAPSSQL